MNETLKEDAWTKIFTDAGIDATDGAKYAKIFVSQKMSRGAINQLDRALLTEMGINVIGHSLAILRINKVKAEDVIPPVKTTTAAKPPAAKAPSLTADITHQQFRKFKVDWSVFETMTRLQDDQYHAQLYSCCDDTVQAALINNHPLFFSYPVDKLLPTLEDLVTQRSNPTVYRMKFSAIIQADDESIQSYVVRLKSAAQDCEFTCPGCQYDLQPINVKDQLIKGLYNEVVQTDILAKADQLTTLELVIKHCEAFETALRNQSLLQDVSDVNSARSAYQKNKRIHPAALKQPNKQNKPCTGCGSTNHWSMERASKCPAWGKECGTCHKSNHFSKVCRFNRNRKVQFEEDVECLEALIAHLTFDKSKDTFTTTSNSIVEEISATLTAFSPSQDSRHSGNIPIHSGKRSRIFPDSGASICIAGPHHLDQLGLSVKHLIPSRKIVRAVGGFKLACKGWIPIQFTVGNRSTKQALYICDKVDRIYFSREGCIDIGILPATFPYPMEESVHHLSMVLNSPCVPHDEGLVPQKVEAVISTDSEIIPRQSPPSRPQSLPYPPTKENIPLLKEYIIEQFRSSAFNATGDFPVLTGPLGHIHKKKDAVPYARHTPNSVPLHMKEGTKKGLDEDVKRKIIAPVPIGSPAEWCTTMVVALKKQGKIRRTLDFQKLNDQCLRETHHTESPFKLACQVPPNTYKTVLDAVDGYHSVMLDEESQQLTNFITEWGRYKCLRMPQGFIAAGDAYTRRYDEIVKDVERKVKIVDDSLLWDYSIEDSFNHTWEYLKLGAENGIVFNQEKFQFCCETAEFAGLQINPTGVSPSDSMLKAIRDFPAPKNITDARSWFGLVNQVAWAYSLAPHMQPFRDLIKPNSKFHWDKELDTAFINSKQCIVDLVKDGIAAFEIGRTTCLDPDWSEEGMGFLLLQKYCQCSLDLAHKCCPDGWKLVFAGSRFCKPQESMYAPSEGEAAAIVWGLNKCHLYVAGSENLIVTTDHEPLLGIFGKRELASIKNARLAKLKTKTLGYQFTIKYIPGKDKPGSDTMSRYPVEVIRSIFSHIRDEVDVEYIPFIEEIEDCVMSVSDEAMSICSNEVSALTPDLIRVAGKADESYCLLIKTIKSGFPCTRQLTNPSIRSYFEVRHRLYTDNELVMLDNRIVIPKGFRRKVLQSLHSAHQGCSGMQSRADVSVYWPGLNSDIQKTRETCLRCTKIAPSQPKEPLIITPTPEWPFQCICMDLFNINNHVYIVCVDRYSGWPITFHLPPGYATTARLISISRQIFIAYGAPDELSSDGGSIFVSGAYRTFLKNWGVSHRLSSAEYAQSNGRAELGVKSAKRIIYDNASSDGSIDNDKVARAILQYRNTPLSGLKASPAQLLLHR